MGSSGTGIEAAADVAPPSCRHEVGSGTDPVTSVVLGISADYHDAAAALVVDGKIVAAMAEERFSRVKHDASLPRAAVGACLEQAGVAPGELDVVAFYSKPLTTYERILVTQAMVGPRGFPTLLRATRSWSSRKLWVRYRIERLLADLGHRGAPILFAEHHVSHAASAFYPSPFDEAAVLTLDGVGEWATASIGVGRANRIDLTEQLRFPASIGLVYSALTSFCGFDVNDGEYKLMGLAPYGTPRYHAAMREHLVHLGPDGEFDVDQRWFDYRAGGRMSRRRLADLLDGPPLRRGEEVGQRQADIAASAQRLVEEVVLAFAARARRSHDLPAVCLAGGVALNCVANARLIDDGPFDDVWVQPAAGDDGGSIGAALWAYHQVRQRPRPPSRGRDGMSGAFLGSRFRQDEIERWLTDNHIDHAVPDDVHGVVASALAGGAVVGWFTGEMEFGPRALGHRSILADPRSPTVAARLNGMVKDRESFRPFAPAVLAEHATDWFVGERPDPYMLVTAPVHPSKRIGATSGSNRSGDPSTFAGRLAERRSLIPACTHLDHSARVQWVDDGTNPRFHRLLSAFHDLTGCPVLLNTSFNRSGEPIVRSPADAFACFRAAELDLLVLEGCVVHRSAGDPVDVGS